MLPNQYLLRLTLSGDVPCPQTKLKRRVTLLIHPVPGWFILLDGEVWKIEQAQQDLDRKELTVFVGQDWQHADKYEARLNELLVKGWEKV